MYRSPMSIIIPYFSLILLRYKFTFSTSLVVIDSTAKANHTPRNPSMHYIFCYILKERGTSIKVCYNCHYC